MEVKAEPGATLVFDSSKIPGEIIDMLAVNTETLKDNPDLGKALVGIWYETHGADVRTRARRARPRAKRWRSSPAPTSPASTPSSRRRTCSTRRRRRSPSPTSPDLAKTMELVRTFCFEHNLLGEGVKSKDAIGIAFPGGRDPGRQGAT